MMREITPNEEVKLIPTLNKMGYSFCDLSEYGRDFLEYCHFVKEPVLDIAAAYGVATLPALEAGAYVIANDLDPRHLEILKSKVPSKFLERLNLKPGKFPQDLDFPEESLSAILASHVFHFLTGEETLEAVHSMYKWLKPGGKAFAIIGTPYVKMAEDFIPLFHQRKQQGEPWPGLIEDLSIYKHKRSADLPKLMHYMDDEIVRRIFTEAGFIIEKLGMFARPDFPEDMRLDGKENVGIVARKPS